MNEFMKDFQENVIPMMEASVAILIILSDSVDSKICLEVGAAVLLNKPIIVVTTSSSLVPKHLATIAYKIVVGDTRTEEVQKQLSELLADLVQA
jgi:hypothetical protein